MLPSPLPSQAPRKQRRQVTSIMEVVLRRVSSPTFVGRSDELAVLERGLERCLEGVPAFTFVAGESGVGKSRLVREFEERATQLARACSSGTA